MARLRALTTCVQVIRQEQADRIRAAEAAPAAASWFYGSAE